MSESGIPQSFINDLSNRIEIVELVGSYVKLTRQGARWWGLCPFHSEKTPSFNVNPENDLYYCFGCNRGGGIYQFIMDMEAVNFPDAVRFLAKIAGMEIPQTGGKVYTRKDDRDSLEELYRKVAGTFRWFFEKEDAAAHARNYLHKRGIGEKIANLYKLGWAPADGEWLFHFLLKKNYSPEFLAKSGLFSRKSPQWSMFVDRIMFPIMPNENRITGFSARILNNNQGPKYINSSQTAIYNKTQELFGMAQAKLSIRRNRQAFLCEGNIDVLSLAEADIYSAVAPLGTSFTPEQAQLIKRRADSITIVFDADEAGRKATLKAASIAEKAGLEVQAVQMPEGMDPAGFFVKEGSEKLKKLLSEPVNIVEYVIQSRPFRSTRDSVKARIDTLADLKPYLMSVDLEVRRSAYIDYISEQLKLTRESILSYLREKKSDKIHEKSLFRSITRKEPFLSEKNIVSNDELYLMSAVVLNTEYFAKVREEIIPEMLREPRALVLYRALEEFSKEGIMPSSDKVILSLEDEMLKNFIFEKSADGIFSHQVEKTIDEKIKMLKVRLLIDERKKLQRQIGVNRNEDEKIITDCMKRIIEVNKEIERINQGEDDRNYN